MAVYCAYHRLGRCNCGTSAEDHVYFYGFSILNGFKNDKNYDSESSEKNNHLKIVFHCGYHVLCDLPWCMVAMHCCQCQSIDMTCCYTPN